MVEISRYYSLVSKLWQKYIFLFLLIYLKKRLREFFKKHLNQWGLSELQTCNEMVGCFEALSECRVQICPNN